MRRTKNYIARNCQPGTVDKFFSCSMTATQWLSIWIISIMALSACSHAKYNAKMLAPLGRVKKVYLSFAATEKESVRDFEPVSIPEPDQLILETVRKALDEFNIDMVEQKAADAVLNVRVTLASGPVNYSQKILFANGSYQTDYLTQVRRGKSWPTLTAVTATGYFYFMVDGGSVCEGDFEGHINHFTRPVVFDLSTDSGMRRLEELEKMSKYDFYRGAIERTGFPVLVRDCLREAKKAASPVKIKTDDEKQEESAYNDASTADELRAFIARYPESEYVGAAEKRLAGFAYAATADTPDELRAFIARYPDSEYVGAARKRLDELLDGH